MGNFGSKSKVGKITEADRAALSLKTQKKKLTDQRNRLEGNVAREVEVARQLIATGRKDRALLALKRKKLQEHQLTNIDSLLVNVEEVLLNIDAAKRNNRLFEALQSGNAALKQIQAGVSIEAVESLMEESAEAKAHEEAIRKLLDESGFAAADEQAVEQEFAALEAEALGEEVAAMPEVPKVETPAADLEGLPSAPTHEAAVPAAATRASTGAAAAALQEEPQLAS